MCRMVCALHRPPLWCDQFFFDASISSLYFAPLKPAQLTFLAIPL